MQTAETVKSARELAHRENQGIIVDLMWDEEDNRVFVEVHDHRTGESFQVDVRPEKALDAYYHPYAYPRHTDTNHSESEPD
jgi:hypothetical protein